MEHTNKKGLLTALGCYVLWGLLPLYWALLHHVSPYNILAQRIIWSGICMAIVVFGIHFGQFKKGFPIPKGTAVTNHTTPISVSYHQY